VEVGAPAFGPWNVDNNKINQGPKAARSYLQNALETKSGDYSRKGSKKNDIMDDVLKILKTAQENNIEITIPEALKIAEEKKLQKYIKTPTVRVPRAPVAQPAAQPAAPSQFTKYTNPLANDPISNMRDRAVDEIQDAAVIMSLKDKIVQLTAAKAEVENKLATASAELVSTKESLTAAEQLHQKAIAAGGSSTAELEASRARVQALEDQTATLSGEVASLNQQLATLQADTDKQLEALKTAQAALAAATEANKSLTNDNQLLRTDILDKTKELDDITEFNSKIGLFLSPPNCNPIIAKVKGTEEFDKAFKEYINGGDFDTLRGKVRAVVATVAKDIPM